MKKDVLISISGLHYGLMEGAEGEEGDTVEVITPATYYLKNGKHYIIYDEVVEGSSETVKNTVKITDDNMFEIKKSGLASTRMVFEKDKINMTNYETPFGMMMLGIYTKDMKVNVEEDQINVEIAYVLDVDNEPVSDCQIKVKVRSVK